MAAPAPHTVLLAGATGLVGGLLLQELLAQPQVARVHALVRRPLGISHPKLHVQVVDFSALPPLPPAHALYLALGTTLKVAGSQAAFRAVDFQANLDVAQAAVAAGVTRVGLVSAAGANARSVVFYNRVKGELEDALKALPLQALVLAQPSLLLGSREGLGQPTRVAERLALPVARWVAPLVPGTYRPVAAQQVARALVQALPRAKGVKVLASGEMARSGA